MNFFQEITILPDPDITAYFIWSKLYNQLHIALADVKNTHGIESIGVSFPDYHFDSKQGKSSKLGNKLRVFAPNKEDLTKLDLNKWLDRLTDYVHIKPIKEVGHKPTSHLIVKRYRYRNMAKQAQNYAEFKGIETSAALAYLMEHGTSNKPYPYINLTSETNKQTYKLAIAQEVVAEPHGGIFNQYGINNASGNTTVPHW